MGGPHVRWLLGAGLVSLLSVQSRGVRHVRAHSAAASAEVRPEPRDEEPTFRAPLEPALPVVTRERAISEPVAPAAAPAAAPVVPACRAELGLIGTVVNERNPRLSWAVVRARGGAAVLAVGGRIDEFIVAAVLPGGAALRKGSGELCALRGFSSAVESVPPAASEPRASADEAREPTPRGKPVFSARELAEGVRRLADNEFLVQKAFLLKALTNPGGSAGGAWFRPPPGEASSSGMEVLGVRDGSALHAMGIRNGDVVRELNGIALDAASGLIAALRSAREAAHVSISVVRDGRPQALHYRVE
jgi:general secretion pathway protein C